MTFRTITQEVLSRSQSTTVFDIHFYPPPQPEELPTVWLDLHVAADGYQDCGFDKVKNFKRSSDGRVFVRIKSHRAIRVYTAETVGVDCDHIAVITNAAGKAKHGLIVAGGKVDPGFSRNKLVIVVYNQAERPIDLYAGDKVACIAFAKVSDRAKATASVGHGNPAFRYAPTWRERLLRWYETQVQPHWGRLLLKLLGKLVWLVLAALAGAYAATRLTVFP